MGKYIGSVAVTGFIAPTDTSDTYATHDAVLGRGGLREVATLLERDAITSDRRTIGMIVYVQADLNYYALFGDTTNLSWKNLGSQLGGYDELKASYGLLNVDVSTLKTQVADHETRINEIEQFAPSYDITVSVVSTMESNELLYVGVIPYDLAIPSVGLCLASARVSADATLDIRLDDASIGSISFVSNRDQAVVTLSRETVINKNSILTIIAPQAVSELADVGVYLTFPIRETI